MFRYLLVPGILLILAALNLSRIQEDRNQANRDVATTQTTQASRETSPKTPSTAPGSNPASKPTAPRETPDQTPRSRETPKRKDFPNSTPDERPLPESRTQEPRDLFSRTIGEHFRSHPSTESRIVRLRQLADRNRPGASNNSSKREQKQGDWIDLAVDIKNRSAYAGTRLFAELVGPLSLEDEWKAGQEIHSQLISTLKIDQEASERLKPLIERLQKFVVRTRQQPFTLTVIQDDTVNAFAHLGGHLYIFHGLLDVLQTENELLFVLGHEVGHVELGHCALAATGGVFAERTLGGLAVPPAQLLQKLLGLSYSEQDEFDADAWSYRTMRAMGKSDRDTVDFFHALLAHEQSKQQK